MRKPALLLSEPKGPLKAIPWMNERWPSVCASIKNHWITFLVRDFQSNSYITPSTCTNFPEEKCKHHFILMLNLRDSLIESYIQTYLSELRNLTLFTEKWKRVSLLLSNNIRRNTIWTRSLHLFNLSLKLELWRLIVLIRHGGGVDLKLKGSYPSLSIISHQTNIRDRGNLIKGREAQ